MPNCDRCGRSMAANEPCGCARPDSRLTVASGHIGIVGQGHVTEPSVDAPDGRRVEARPAEGGRSSSQTGASGEFSIVLEAPLATGRRAEPRVLETLEAVLRARGDTVERVEGSKDDRGEDGLFRLNGKTTTAQVVSIPTDQQLRLSRPPWAAHRFRSRQRCGQA